jgi:hypothetical protein
LHIKIIDFETSFETLGHLFINAAKFHNNPTALISRTAVYGMAAIDDQQQRN